MMAGEMNKQTSISYIPLFSSEIHPFRLWISSLLCYLLCYDVAWAWDGRDGTWLKKWTFICLYTFSVQYHPLLMLPCLLIIMRPIVSLSIVDLSALVLLTFSSLTFNRNLSVQNHTSQGSIRESFTLQGSLRGPHIVTTFTFANRFIFRFYLVYFTCMCSVIFPNIYYRCRRTIQRRTLNPFMIT